MAINLFKYRSEVVVASILGSKQENISINQVSTWLEISEELTRSHLYKMALKGILSKSIEKPIVFSLSQEFLKDSKIYGIENTIHAYSLR